MKKNVIIIGFSALTILGACDSKKIKDKDIMPDFTDNTMDLSIKPGTNFYMYSNGNWMKNNPLPGDKSRYGSFDVLREKAQKDSKAIIEETSKGKHKLGTSEQKIGDLYNLGMDTMRIEKEGINPIKSELAKIDKIKNRKDIQNQIAHFHHLGISTTFSLGGSADPKNSEFVICHIGQGGIGLPDREYYLENDVRMKNIRKEYLTHIEKMFTLCGISQKDATSMAKKVMQLETRLAKASMDKLARRDPHKTYNKVDFNGLKKITPYFNWENYLNTIELPYRGDFNIAQVEFFNEFNIMLKDTKTDIWKAYFKWNIINTTSPYLNKELVKQDFNFYGKILKGQPEMSPRWKKVSELVNNAIGEEVGKLYVKKHFPPRAKEKMQDLVNNLKWGMNKRISQLNWMSDETKAKAQEKLKFISVKVGYPDIWKNYFGLTIDSNKSYIENVIAALSYNKKLSFAKIGKTVDPNEWFMTPQTVNAYYHPLKNEIVFPAAILQPPFFYLDADDAVNYGAIGVVIGHEMTHGFDDKGRMFDKDGNLNSWWTKEDSKNFEARAQVLIDRFDKFIVIEDMHADGKFTLGENIADLGGLNISYTAALEAWSKNKPKRKIDGFTPEQRFFLAYARLWAQNIRDKEIIRLTNEDVHSLGKFRVIGPLPNMEEWYKAFNITSNDSLYIPIEKRASIW